LITTMRWLPAFFKAASSSSTLLNGWIKSIVDALG
jgi:hypothetical protein